MDFSQAKKSELGGNVEKCFMRCEMKPESKALLKNLSLARLRVHWIGITCGILIHIVLRHWRWSALPATSLLAFVLTAVKCHVLLFYFCRWNYDQLKTAFSRLEQAVNLNELCIELEYLPLVVHLPVRILRLDGTGSNHVPSSGLIFETTTKLSISSRRRSYSSLLNLGILIGMFQKLDGLCLTNLIFNSRDPIILSSKLDVLWIQWCFHNQTWNALFSCPINEATSRICLVREQTPTKSDVFPIDVQVQTFTFGHEYKSAQDLARAWNVFQH